MCIMFFCILCNYVICNYVSNSVSMYMYIIYNNFNIILTYNIFMHPLFFIVSRETVSSAMILLKKRVRTRLVVSATGNFFSMCHDHRGNFFSVWCDCCGHFQMFYPFSTKRGVRPWGVNFCASIGISFYRSQIILLGVTPLPKCAPHALQQNSACIATTASKLFPCAAPHRGNTFCLSPKAAAKKIHCTTENFFATNELRGALTTSMVRSHLG